MDARFRPLFNQRYSPDVYRRLCALMDERLSTPRFEFRLAEIPVMLPPDLRVRCEEAAAGILSRIRRPEVLRACREAVPARYDAPHEDALPHFLAIDLAVVEGPGGRLEPRLIELQGFSSLYGMTFVHAGVWSELLAAMPGMPSRWTPLFSGLSDETYIDLLRRTVIAEEDPEHVILLDLQPDRQKTRPDFHATARLLGVRAVCVTELTREGRQLYAPRKEGAGRSAVRRVLHRVVFDELERERTPMCFDYRDDLDVVWVSHPNWYWLWSKYTLPLIDHPAVPWTRRLDQVGALPADLSRYILKPIFSFAGQGVHVDLSPRVLDAIPPAERSGYLLQEKVDYAAALVAPDGSRVKAEIRMMYLHPDGADEMTLAINLCRLSRGKMHGVDHNKGLDWVGSSVAIWPVSDAVPRP